MNKNKLLTGIVITLLLFNTAALIYMWTSNNKDKRSAINSPAEFLIKKTGMDSVQKEKYYELVKAHRKATRRLKDDLKQAREAYFSLLGKAVSDTTKEIALQKINAINSELSKITFDHFTAVRTICNKEQKVKFDAAIEEVLNMMGGPPHSPGEKRGDRPMHDRPPHDRPPDDSRTGMEEE